MQGGDHGLELGHLAAGAAGPDGGRVAVVGGEEADGVVAPVIGEPPLDQERLRHVLVHREQLDRGHPEVGQVGQRGVVAQPRIGAAQLEGHAGMAHGEPLDMHLVDDGVGVAVPGPGGGVGPVEGGVDDQAAGDMGGRVERAGPVGVADVVPEDLRAEPDRPGGGPGVGVEQQLGRVAAHPTGRLPGVGGAVAVRLADAHTLDEAVPDAGVVVRQGDPCLGAGVVEQAQQHRVGHARRHREVGPARAWGGPQREAAARAHPHPMGGGGGHGRLRSSTTRTRSARA